MDILERFKEMLEDTPFLLNIGVAAITAGGVITVIGRLVPTLNLHWDSIDSPYYWAINLAAIISSLISYELGLPEDERRILSFFKFK